MSERDRSAAWIALAVLALVMPSAVAAQEESERAAPASEQLGAPGLSAPAAEAAVESEPAPPEEEPARDVVDEREVVSSSARTLLGAQAGVWLETGVTAGGPSDGSVVALSPELGLRYRVTDEIVADASFGLTYAATHVSGDAMIGGEPTPYDASMDRVDPGNPTLGGAFVHRAPGVLLEIGLSLALPTAARAEPGADATGAAQRASSEVSRRAAMAMRGYRGAWRWAPERLSFALPFRIVIPVDALSIEIDGALATMIPVLGDRTVDVDTLVDVGAGIGAQVVGPLALGARIGGVGGATGTMLPTFTLSIEPWARLRFDPVQITARGVMNLTGPDALGAERGPSFGALVGVGVEI